MSSEERPASSARPARIGLRGPDRAATPRLAARLHALRPTRALVDLDAVAANFAYLRERAGGAEVLCVVKANAYGHGAVPTARRLEAEGAGWFGVALVEEGVELREAGVRARVLLLGGADPAQLEVALARDLTPAVVSLQSLEALEAIGRRRGRPVRCHVKVDTGMTRLGLGWDELPQLAPRLAGNEHLEVEGVLTHLACSDDPAVPFTGVQLDRFRRSVACLREHGVDRPLLHVASSAGLLTRAETDVELVRPGVALYGLNPFGNEPAPELTPALTLVSRIIRLVTVPAGTAVGYGGTFITLRESRLATLPVGYDDGLSRRLSDGWEVSVRDEPAPVVGRISMDLTVADVTDIPEAAVGDDVIVAGGSPGLSAAASFERMAHRLRTIPYEVTCSLSWRIPRVFHEAGQVVGISSRFEHLDPFVSEQPPLGGTSTG